MTEQPSIRVLAELPPGWGGAVSFDYLRWALFQRRTAARVALFALVGAAVAAVTEAWWLVLALPLLVMGPAVVLTYAVTRRRMTAVEQAGRTIEATYGDDSFVLRQSMAASERAYRSFRGVTAVLDEAVLLAGPGRTTTILPRIVAPDEVLDRLRANFAVERS